MLSHRGAKRREREVCGRSLNFELVEERLHRGVLLRIGQHLEASDQGRRPR